MVAAIPKAMDNCSFVFLCISSVQYGSCEYTIELIAVLYHC